MDQAAPQSQPTHSRDQTPRNASRLEWSTRLIALVVFVPALALLLVAAQLSPAERGYGTHTQLGLQPCGFEAATGLPCATCGMTTSFAHAANGQLLHSFMIQPAGMVLAVLTAMAVLLSGWSLVSGMPLTPILGFLWKPRVVVALIVLVLAAWGYTAGRVFLAG